MSKWGTASAKERLSAPASIFCGPDRTFPVGDQEDLNNAVRRLNSTNHATGPIKSCIMGKAKANGWKMPEAWMSAGEAISVVTLAAFASSDATVTRRGKIFEAGDYPDKSFSADIEDLYLAALDFTAVPNDLEHTPTILDGKLGQLTKVELDPDGSLVGEVEIPRWLDDIIGVDPVKTSLMWDRETKRIVGNALVLEPRIADAMLVSAFNAVTPGNHNHTLNIPAFSPATEEPHAVYRQHGHMHEALRAPVEETADPVGLLATIKALLMGKDPKPAATLPPVVTAPATAEEVTVADAVEFKDTQEYKDMAAQIAQLLEQDKARAAREATRDAEVIRERAATWAEAEIAAFRALPSERAALIAAYADAATDDQAAPRVVSFTGKDGAETTGNRVDALKARQAARPQHMLTQEQLRMTPEQLREAGVVFAQRPSTADTGTMNTARHDELITLSGFSLQHND